MCVCTPQDRESDVFMQELRAYQDRPVTLDVYNAKNGALRGVWHSCCVGSPLLTPLRFDSSSVVEATPRHWGGIGLLGLYVRFGSYAALHDQILHMCVALCFCPSFNSPPLSFPPLCPSLNSPPLPR
jgi:hypothetical protein